MQLANFNVDEFKRDYWQQRPLLIRGAIPGFEDPLDANELAGFAIAEHGEETPYPSQLIFSAPWRRQDGPFTEERLQTLPDNDWSMLLQSVDFLSDEIAALHAYFAFIPSWRREDIMASVSAPGGSVGPHFDYYDVFLLQGNGRKQWQLGQRCDENTAVVDSDGVQMLAEFECEFEAITEPGDILYVPPGVAHHGIALELATTYSIGFRAPAHAELLLDWAHHKAATLPQRQRFTDSADSSASEIHASEIDRLQATLQTLANDRASIADYFGQRMSEPLYSESLYPEPNAAGVGIDTDGTGFLHRHAHTRIAWHRLDDGLGVYVNGESFRCAMTDLDFIRTLENTQLAGVAIADLALSDSARELLAALLASGAFYLEG